MSEIRANTIANAAGTGPAALTGQAAVKASAAYDQTVPDVTRELNVSSVTDTSQGVFTINYTNNFANNDYGVLTGLGKEISGGVLISMIDDDGASLEIATDSVGMRTTNVGGPNDRDTTSTTSIEGDLA